MSCAGPSAFTSSTRIAMTTDRSACPIPRWARVLAFQWHISPMVVFMNTTTVFSKRSPPIRTVVHPLPAIAGCMVVHAAVDCEL